MGITDAIKSGLQYKRTGGTVWLMPNSNNLYAPSDILATDWITQANPVTITTTSYWAAATPIESTTKDVPTAFKLLATALGV